jgi:DNA-directed RNA polymerase specialized sigma24 family protein
MLIQGSTKSVTEDEPTDLRAVEDAVARAVAAVASLPLDQRKVLTVAVASDLTYADIAQQGKFAPTDVLQWMRDGLHAIAGALDTSADGETAGDDRGPSR